MTLILDRVSVTTTRPQAATTMMTRVHPSRTLTQGVVQPTPLVVCGIVQGVNMASGEVENDFKQLVG